MITRLFLNNEEVELDNQVDFTINKAFEDITDPTTIINEWSKTVNIPFTNRNNQLFGSIFSIDRQILTGGSHPTGIYFDPTKKADFKLLYNNSLIMSGYCKLTTVTIKNSGSYYNINLFGQLGNIFHELQQLSFNPDLTDPSNVKYTIGKFKGYDDAGFPIYEPYINEFINKDLVYKSWTTEPCHFNLKDADWWDIIGFACCNQGYNPDFDSSIIQTATNENKSASDLLTQHYVDEGITPQVTVDATIGDGLLPRQYGEYRSYYQTPYIYVNKMFQMLQAKCKELTDYEVVLDPTWFNPQNPYYSQLVMLLNNFSAAQAQTGHATNLYRAYAGGAAWVNTTRTNPSEDDYVFNYITDQQFKMLWNDGDLLLAKDPVIGGMNLHIAPDTFNMQFDIQSWYTQCRLNPNTALKVDLFLYGGNKEIVFPMYFIKDKSSTLTNSNYTEVTTDLFTIEGTYANYYVDVPALDFVIPQDFLDALTPDNWTFQLGVRWSWETQTHRALAFRDGNWTNQYLTTWVAFNVTQATNWSWSANLTFTGVRSNTPLTLQQFWDEKTTFFDCILNYCKTYGILFKVDEVNKQLHLLHRTTYFKDYTIEDWSDKLDRTQDFIISPITFDTKYVSFNYDSNNTDFNETYLKKYGVNYGGLKLKTLYEFNNDNTDLFKGLKTSLVSAYTVLPWNKMLEADITYYQTGETMPYFENDKQPTDTFGCFYFYKGLHDFDFELGKVRITDDTNFQITHQTYSYLQDGAASDKEIEVTTYPYLDIFYGDNLCLFNNPSESYDINQEYNDKDSIYLNFWKDWMDEQYNVQNKKISCYLNIHPIDYLKFDFKHFIMIENQLYLLNKIEDYDITNPETTKCELIGIQSTDAYTTIPFGGDYLILSEDHIELYGGMSTTITVKSNNGFTVGSHSSLVINVTPTSSTKKEDQLTIYARAIPSEDVNIILPIKNGDITVNLNITIKKSINGYS